MNWKIVYWGRLVAEKVLSLFGVEVLQELAKKATGRKSVCDESFILRRVDCKLEEFGAFLQGRDIKVVHEQGTGWHGIDLVVFHLLGLRVFSTDVRDLLNYELLKSVIRVLAKNIDKYEDYRDQIENLAANTDLSREEFCQLMGVTYYIDDRFRFSGVEHIDLFYSYSVLQRMKKDDLSKYLARSREVASSNFTHYHQIDCNDFFSIGQKDRVPPFYYLTASEGFWEFITSKKLNYQNRLRMPEYVEIFEASGFDCSTLDELTTDDYVEYIRQNRDRMRQTESMTDHEVAIAHFSILASRSNVVRPELRVA